MKQCWSVAIGCLSLVACPLAASELDYFLDSLSDRLIYQSEGGDFQVQGSGLVDFELLYTDQHPPGLIIADDRFFFNPRLTVFVDAFWGQKVYAFAKLRADRGLDPGYSRDGDVRADEYFLRYTLGNGAVNLQAGQFATHFGNWAGRHDSWENPFINAPLPYENVTTVLDRGVLPDRQAFLALRDNHDVKKNWIPAFWGPVYTLGFSVFGRVEKFSYALSLKNAAVSSRPSVWNNLDWDHPTWTGRVAFQPNEAWKFGASATAGYYLQDGVQPLLPAGTRIDDYDQVAFGGDLSWARGPWQVWAEIMRSEFDIPNVGTLGTTVYYIEAKYKLSAQWFSAVRWGQQFFDETDDGAGGRIRWDRGMSKLEFALGYRISRHLQFKVQYSFGDQDGFLEQGQQFAATQLTVKF